MVIATEFSHAVRALPNEFRASLHIAGNFTGTHYQPQRGGRNRAPIRHSGALWQRRWWHGSERHWRGLRASQPPLLCGDAYKAINRIFELLEVYRLGEVLGETGTDTHADIFLEAEAT